MMHEGAIRVMAEGASGRALPVTRGTACGGVVMATAGKTPKTKGGRRQVEGVHGVIPDREEVVRGDVGHFHRYSLRWPDAPSEEPTSSVGSPVPRN